MKHLELCGCSVRVDDSGLLSLTDMWQASGAHKDKHPDRFLKEKGTIRFIHALKNQHIGGSTTVKRHNGEVWAFRYITYKYAGWLDPGFEVAIYRLLDAYYTDSLGQRITRKDIEDIKICFLQLQKELQIILELEDLI